MNSKFVRGIEISGKFDVVGQIVAEQKGVTTLRDLKGNDWKARTQTIEKATEKEAENWSELMEPSV